MQLRMQDFQVHLVACTLGNVEQCKKQLEHKPQTVKAFPVRTQDTGSDTGQGLCLLLTAKRTILVIQWLNCIPFNVCWMNKKDQNKGFKMNNSRIWRTQL